MIASSPSNNVAHANDVNSSSSSSLMMDEIERKIPYYYYKGNIFMQYWGQVFQNWFRDSYASEPTRLIDEYGNIDVLYGI